jgi:NADPH2:quinone reductase
MQSFRAFRIFNDEGTIAGRLVDATVDELTPGEVLIKAEYSSVNYKDALAGTGTGKILRKFPLIGGIDVAGTVASSASPAFAPGDRVLVTGYDFGVANDGGYAAYVRVPAAWVVRVPDGLTSFEAMALGTAGFTAATGGVGSIAVAALTRLGYDVTAMTGKDDAHEYLKTLGAKEILDRKTLTMGTRPLEASRWAAAIDAVGGDTLAWLTRTTAHWGGIASTGLTGGVDLHTTVMPFILRGVSLIGIDSALPPMDLRIEAWRRLAADMKPTQLDTIAHPITLDQLPHAFATLLDGRARGRFVVQIN